MVGGRDSGVNVFNDVWSSENGETWVQVVSAAPWGARQAFSLVATNDKMYLIGGLLGSTYRNDVWVTDDGVTWNMLTGSAPFAGRAGHRAVAFNNGIMLMGGVNSSGYLNDVWFSTDGTNWNQQVVNAAWSARADFGLVTFGTKMYVLGGANGGGAMNNYYSSPDGITWALESAAAWVQPLTNLGATVYDAKIWVIGGDNNGGTYYNDVYSTSTGSGAFTTVTLAPGFSNRSKFGCVTFRAPAAVSSVRPPIMWVIGGDAGGATTDVWRSDVNGAVNNTWTIPTSASNQPMDWCTSNGLEYLVMKDTAGMYVLWGNALTKVADKNYPTTTVRGVVNLDETIYVMDPTGLIYGSALETPYIWPSFNFIGADYESDKGVCLAKYRNFVVAFGEFTIQLFYNSGVGPSLLRPVQNANIRVGCAYADSVAGMNTTLYWVGRDQKSLGWGVYRFNGMGPEKVSDPYIERVLEGVTVTNIKGSCYRFQGHDFYIITVVGAPGGTLSFAFDATTGLWHRWGLFQSNVWSCTYNASVQVLGTEYNFALNDNTGVAYIIYPTSYTDAGTAITVEGQTNAQDGGTSQYKFCPRVVVVGDRVANLNISLLFSDDDFQSINTAGIVSMDQVRPSLNRVGRFVRRSWRWQTVSNTYLRLEAVEAFTDVGNT